MKRRKFLVTTAGVLGSAGLGFGQGQNPAAPAGQPAGQGAGRGGPAGGGRGGPANVPAAKLARIGIMSAESRQHAEAAVEHQSHSESDARADRSAAVPTSTSYGVHNVEFQHSHLAQDAKNPDPAFFKELKAKFDAVGSRANQINIEIGTLAQMGPDGKAAALAAKRVRPGSSARRNGSMSRRCSGSSV